MHQYQELSCRQIPFSVLPPYLKTTPKMFEHIRETCGDEVELLHDIHERVAPIEAINLLNQIKKEMNSRSTAHLDYCFKRSRCNFVFINKSSILIC